jgi:iron complex outermembrane recepter protein
MRSTHIGNSRHGIASGMALAAVLLCASGFARAQGQPPAPPAPPAPAPTAQPQQPPAPQPPAPPPATSADQAPAAAPQEAAPAPQAPAAAESAPAAVEPSSGLSPEEEAALKEAEAPKESPAAGEAPLETTAAPAAETGSDEVSEEMIITGSRISRNKKEQFAQVAVVSAKEIKASGATTIDEVLNKLPSLTLQGMNRQNNNGGNGLAFIDLRNLGTSRTLVLINGKRFVSSGEFGSGVDMNNIPVAMIERIEVLLDGASAIYGSDAIGGVVNIILKKDFEGVQVDVGGGLSTHGGDGKNMTASVTMGGNHKHGNAALNVTYTHQSEVEQKNRSWAKNPVMDEYYVRDENGKQHVVRDYGSFNTKDGVISSWNDDYYSNNGNWESIYTPDYSDLNDTFKSTMYNFGADQWLIGRMDRLSLTTLADYKLGSHATAYLEGTYTFRKSSNQMAPQPLGATTYYPEGPTIPITNPYLPSNVVAAEGAMGSEYFWFYRRMVEAGDRVFENEASTYRFVVGLQGDFIKDRLGYDVYASTSRSMNSYIMRNAIDLGRVIETLDPAACAANPNCPGVGNYFGQGNLQPAVLDYIRYDELSSTTWNMIDTGLSLNSKLVQIPFGGWLSAALGAEFRWEKGSNLPEGMVTQGYSQSNLLDPTQGSYNAQEFFGEISIPILKNKPAFHALTADIAGRLSVYDTFGAQFTYRTGLSWAPIPDFTLRGVYSTAFRAPSISDLYGGATDSYLEVNDPCDGWDSLDPSSTLYQNCQASGAGPGFMQTSTQIRTNIGSNPNLNAETARIVNAGVVITPTFIPQAAGDLILSTDFYRINIESAIASLDPQTIVDECYNSPDMSTNYYCQFIDERSPTGDINGLNAIALNISEVETYGLDLSASYMIPLPRELAINLGWDGNILLKYSEYNKVADKTEESAGTIGSADVTGGSFAKLRWIFNLGLGSERWNLTNRLRFIGRAELFGLDDLKKSAADEADAAVAAGDITAAQRDDYYADLLPPTKGVDPIAYWDIVVTYNVASWDFTLGVDNILDTDPPFVLDASVNTNVQTYDFMGRYIYGNIGYKF